MKIRLVKKNADQAFRAASVFASAVLLGAAFLCSSLPPTANAEDVAPSDSGQNVHS